jgi:hypothetical protein
MRHPLPAFGRLPTRPPRLGQDGQDENDSSPIAPLDLALGRDLLDFGIGAAFRLDTFHIRHLREDVLEVRFDLEERGTGFSGAGGCRRPSMTAHSKKERMATGTAATQPTATAHPTIDEGDVKPGKFDHPGPIDT